MTKKPIPPEEPAADNPNKPERTHGFRHVIAASTYSFAGLRIMARESAFRQEVFGFVGILILFTLLGATSAQFLMAAILFLLLIAVEALNTSVEVVVDHLSPDWSEFAKDAKDLGSFAVACLLLANGLNLVYVTVIALRNGTALFF